MWGCMSFSMKLKKGNSLIVSPASGAPASWMTREGFHQLNVSIVWWSMSTWPAPARLPTIMTSTAPSTPAPSACQGTALVPGGGGGSAGP